MSDERSGRTSTFRFEVAIDEASEHNFWSGLAMEGADGIFVATYQPLRLGTIIELAVQLPGEAKAVSATGIVRWTRSHREGSDGAVGVGLAFEEPSDELREKAARFTSSVREPILFDLEDAPMRRRGRSSSPEPEPYDDRAAE